MLRFPNKHISIVNVKFPINEFSHAAKSNVFNKTKITPVEPPDTRRDKESNFLSEQTHHGAEIFALLLPPTKSPLPLIPSPHSH